jgi:hypothetical protein
MHRYTPLIALASLVAVLATVKVATSLTSQNVPPADLPPSAASPGVNSATSPSSLPSPAALRPSDEEGGSESAPTNNGSISEKSSPGPTESNPASEASAAPAEENTGTEGDESSPAAATGSEDLGNEQPAGTSGGPAATEPPPALDTSTLTAGPELGNASLQPEINNAVAPALAASLRLTEGARKQLAVGLTDDAMRELARAVSLDPSDAFAYYYLGRGYLQKKNYEQALTFFRRAEIGFSGRADWSAEVLSYDGACDEELGKPTDALQAYQRALAASPNNLRARVGYGRLAAVAGPVGNLNESPPEQDLSALPPGAPPDSAPSEQTPPPPPDDLPEGER